MVDKPLLLYFAGSGPEKSEAVQTAPPAGRKSQRESQVS